MSDNNFEPTEGNLISPDDDMVQARRDAAFARRLDSDLRFEARPEFQAGLRTSLMATVSSKNAPSAARPAKKTFSGFIFSGLFAKNSWKLATVGAMVCVVLLVAAIVLLSKPAPEVVVGENGATPANGAAEVDRYYDNQSGDYIMAGDAGAKLGYSPSIPQALPGNYQMDFAGIFTSPDVTSNGFSVSPSLFVKYKAGNIKDSGTTTKTTTGRTVEVYQSQLISTMRSGLRQRMAQMMINRIKKVKEQQVHGMQGYLIEDSNWQLGYFGAGNQNGSDDSLMPGEALRQALQNKPVPRVIFSRNAIGRGMAGGFIDFRSITGNSSSKSLVWSKDGLVTVVVGSEQMPTEELVKVAEAFK